ncbi:DUF3299 domain-containing protein [uncultured Lamprocystis sp.]|jgi:hypothetical protein|uniref:DUF3299 domain-containing protein n=1 Tax=uncultured Lamprocystis sp. TaxID=543132 RepID=UPI0025F3BE6D|nr:DUF3299 domain-containing protein [uncultured Lamprocystis sp.]
MRLIDTLAALVLAAALAGCDSQSDDGQANAAKARTAAAETAAAPELTAATPQDLDWDTLIPEDWQPDTLFDKYDLNSLQDDDPQAKELMGKLKQLWAEAPVVSALDGKLVRLPGFIVPVESESTKITEFLLVPYYGACIHVPPPPANQTVYVKLASENAFEGELFDTVWVTGTLKVTPTSSDLADAGYRIEATGIAPYKSDDEPSQ